MDRFWLNKEFCVPTSDSLIVFWWKPSLGGEIHSKVTDASSYLHPKIFTFEAPGLVPNLSGDATDAQNPSGVSGEIQTPDSDMLNIFHMICQANVSLAQFRTLCHTIRLSKCKNSLTSFLLLWNKKLNMTIARNCSISFWQVTCQQICPLHTPLNISI